MMSLLRLKTLHAPDSTVVSTRGDIDIATSQTLDDYLMTLINEGRYNIVLNFSHTSYLDSTGLAVLLRAHKKLRENGGQLSVIGCLPQVKRVFSMVGFHRLFPIQEYLPKRSRTEDGSSHIYIANAC
jgi:anti-anti-sigma factor